jgi:hypothetical protein
MPKEYSYKLEKNIFPENLEKLYILKYNFKIENDVLPNKLKYLCLGTSSNLDINALPAGLEKLILLEVNNYIKIPESLLYLQIHCCGIYELIFKELPLGLVELNIQHVHSHKNMTNLRSCCICKNANCKCITLSNLPCNIQKIRCSNNLQNKLVKIPFGCTINSNYS